LQIHKASFAIVGWLRLLHTIIGGCIDIRGIQAVYKYSVI
jgi:hypothetical protein